MKFRRFLAMLLALTLLCSIPVCAADEEAPEEEPTVQIQVLVEPTYAGESEYNAGVCCWSDYFATFCDGGRYGAMTPFGDIVYPAKTGYSIGGIGDKIFYTGGDGGNALFKADGTRVSPFCYYLIEKSGNYVMCSYYDTFARDFYTMDGRQIKVKNLPKNYELWAVLDDNTVLAGTVDRTQFYPQRSMAFYSMDGKRLRDETWFIDAYRLDENIIVGQTSVESYVFDNDFNLITPKTVYSISKTYVDGLYVAAFDNRSRLLWLDGRDQGFPYMSVATAYSENCVIASRDDSSFTYNICDSKANVLYEKGDNWNPSGYEYRGQKQTKLFSMHFGNDYSTGTKVFDYNGNVILDGIDGYHWLTSGTVSARQNGKMNYYDETGKLLLSLDGEDYSPLLDGFIFGKENDMYAVWNIEGEQLTKALYTAYQEANVDGLYNVKRGGKWYLINTKGEELNKSGFDKPVQFENGSHVAAFGVKGLWGVLRYMEPGNIHPFFDVPGGKWYTAAVEACFDKGLMNGTATGRFSPDVTTSRAMVVQILYNYAGNGEKCVSCGFADVPDGKWFSDAVNWAATNDIVSGMGNGKFSPNDPVTREQVAAILYRFAAKNGADIETKADLSGYPDAAKVSSWATDAMQWAVGIGIISGTGKGELNPLGKASRAEVASLLLRFTDWLGQNGGAE